jgi:integrase
MANITKRGDSWRAQVKTGGVRESKSFDTKAEAVEWSKNMEVEILAGKRRAYSKVAKTLSDGFDKYLEEISPEKGKHEWNKTRIAFFKTELDFVGELMRNVRPEQITAWKNKRLKDVKTSTVNRDLNLLSAVFTAARDEWKWIHDNPVQEVKRPKDPPPRRRRVPEHEAATMAAALGLTDDCEIETTQQYTALAFLIAIESAMRQGELIGTHWPNVHLEEKYVHVPKSKNGDARDVPLSVRAVELWKRLPRIKGESRCFPVAQSSVDALWRKVRNKVAKEKPEYGDLNFHDSRHEATTRLSKKLHVLALAKMIGHRDIQSLMIYYDETAAELAERLD